MQDDAREVTTFCPHCGRPIVWSVTPVPGGGVQLEVTAFACHCPLSDEEWDGLSDQAMEILEEEG